MRILVIILLLLSSAAYSQNEIFRIVTTGAGWEYLDPDTDTWTAMTLYDDPVLADGIGALTSSSNNSTIRGKIFTNSGATNSGHCLTSSNVTNLTVEYCIFKTSNAVGFRPVGGSGLTIQYCLFTDVVMGIYVFDQTGNLKIKNNYGLNFQWDRTAPISGTFRNGQFIHTGNVTGTGNEILDNRIENVFGRSYNEDCINLYDGHGTSGSHFKVRRNLIRGGGASGTGGGILMGDACGTYNDVDSNRLIHPGWYGVQIYGGNTNRATYNYVFSEPQMPWNSVGYLIYDGGCTCTNMTMNTTNVGRYRRSAVLYAGNIYNFEDGGGCSGGPFNVTASTTLTPANMPMPDGSTGFPDRLIDCVSEDDYWKLINSDWRASALINSFGVTGPTNNAPNVNPRRPTANAGSDQSISISSATLTSSSSIATGGAGTFTLTGHSWVYVSGPGGATIVSPTSSSTSVTGLTNGTHVIRYVVEQNHDEYDLKTYDPDWITITVTSAQTKYYISNSGSDAAAGTLAAPWQTIAKVNSSTFSAGDTIFFNRGNQWREQLTLPSSGAVNNRIVFTAYGTGAKPIINAADIETGWTSAGSNQWYINNPNAVTTRAMVIIDNVIYAEEASLAAVNAANEYFIDVSATPDRIYVYSTDDPDLHTVEVSNREYCIITASGASSKKYIEISDIEVRYAGRGGIYFEGPGAGGGDALNGASYVKRCFAYANRLFGIVHYDHYDSLTVEDSKATYNGNGFYSWVADEGTFRRDTTSNQIQYNVTFTDGHAIGGYQSDNWLVENCYSDADYDAIHLDAGNVATDAIIRYNKVFNSRSGSPDTPGYGIGNTAAGAVVQMYYNLAVNCAEASQTSSSAAHAGTITVYNNTFYHNTSTGTNGIVYFNHGTGYTFKNNLYVRDYVAGELGFVIITSAMSTNDYNNYYILNNVSGTLRNWLNGAAYTTMADWRTATSQDANSISADPLFVNVASDWSLQSGSPCRNAGVSVGLTQDILGNSIVGNPDIGAYELSAIAGDPPYPAGRKLPVKVQ